MVSDLPILEETSRETRRKKSDVSLWPLFSKYISAFRSFASAQVAQVMQKGYSRQQFGVEWLASQCCPFLFKAPVVAVPDNSPKEVGKDDGLM